MKELLVAFLVLEENIDLAKILWSKYNKYTQRNIKQELLELYICIVNTFIYYNMKIFPKRIFLFLCNKKKI